MNELIEYDYQERIKALEAELRRKEADLAGAARSISDLERTLGWANKPVRAPRWLAPRKKKHSEHVAIACSILSDLHLDEVVDPAEMSGHNAYNRAIATFRLRQFFENAIKVTQQFWSGTTYEGFVLALGGDGFTGLIHGELDRTNDGQGPYESMEYWVPHFVAGITLLADVFGKVFIPCTVGNHGRFRQGKWGHKRRVKENMDWALAKRLEAHFATDERITFLIPDDPDVPFSVYEVRFLLNHLAPATNTGGNGRAGIFSPMGILYEKKRRRWDFDVMIGGHWHQYVPTPDQGYIVNGSLKGFDDFARDFGFLAERPQQALWLVTPEHGITEQAPVIVSNRKQEGW